MRQWDQGEWRHNRNGDVEIVVERRQQSKTELEPLLGTEMTVEVSWKDQPGRKKRKTLESAIVTEVRDGLIFLERR